MLGFTRGRSSVLYFVPCRMKKEGIWAVRVMFIYYNDSCFCLFLHFSVSVWSPGCFPLSIIDEGAGPRLLVY
jgi:hypothetical protein